MRLVEELEALAAETGEFKPTTVVYNIAIDAVGTCLDTVAQLDCALGFCFAVMTSVIV